MNWIVKALTGIGGMIAGIFTTPAAQTHVIAVLKTAGELAVQLYPTIEAIAAVTPNRTDDQIVTAVQKFGVLGIVDPNQPDKAAVLHDIALNVAKNTVASTVASSVISLAIETAYQAFKANAAEAAAKAK